MSIVNINNIFQLLLLEHALLRHDRWLQYVLVGTKLQRSKLLYFVLVDSKCINNNNIIIINNSSNNNLPTPLICVVYYSHE